MMYLQLFSTKSLFYIIIMGRGRGKRIRVRTSVRTYVHVRLAGNSNSVADATKLVPVEAVPVQRQIRTVLTVFRVNLVVASIAILLRVAPVKLQLQYFNCLRLPLLISLRSATTPQLLCHPLILFAQRILHCRFSQSNDHRRWSLF